MEKIVILSCLKVNENCSGMACMRAYFNRTKAFERYAGTETELLTFMRCSHCHTEVDPLEDPGFLKKLNRVAEAGCTTVHIGHCANKKETGFCPGMQKMIDAFREKGINVVIGTH